MRNLLFCLDETALFLKRLKSAKWSRIRNLLDRFSSCRSGRQSQLPPYQRKDLRMSLCCRTSRVDHRYSLGLAPGDREIGIAHATKERTALLLESVLIAFRAFISRRASHITTAGALHTRGNVRVHQNRQLGLQVSAENAMQSQHRLRAQLSATALVSFRRVGKPVAQHKFPLRDSRLNNFFDVLRARSEHEG